MKDAVVPVEDGGEGMADEPCVEGGVWAEDGEGVHLKEEGRPPWRTGALWMAWGWGGGAGLGAAEAFAAVEALVAGAVADGDVAAVGATGGIGLAGDHVGEDMG